MTRLGLLAALALVSACAAVPPPSELAGARWWNGSDFDADPRFVARGRFQAPGDATSERVELPPLFAVPLSPGDCDRRPVLVSVPFPSARTLQPGAPADFYLTPTDPRGAAPTPVAFVCGGLLVE